MLRELSGDSAYAFPGPKGEAMNWVQKACERIMESAGIEDGRHHDTRRVLQTNMAEMGVLPGGWVHGNPQRARPHRIGSPLIHTDDVVTL